MSGSEQQDRAAALERRLGEALGGSVPSDPEAVGAALRTRLKVLQEQRRRDERSAETLPAALQALSRAEHDVALRSSPELRRLQDRGEDLRLRMHRARDRADTIVLNLAHWQEAIKSGRGSEPPSPHSAAAEDADDVDNMGPVVRMQAMLDEFAAVRAGTDRIGRDGDA